MGRRYSAQEAGEDSRRAKEISDGDVQCSTHTRNGSAGMPLVCMPKPLEAPELEKHHVDVNALVQVEHDARFLATTPMLGLEK